MSKQDKTSGLDIYKLLLEESEKSKKERRAQLLKPLGVKEYFEEGGINIDKKTCKGVECKLCIEVCPTHALYWKAGEVGIIEDLCIFCAACVWICCVDDCIRVWRKRPEGRVEEFSNPKNVLTLMQKIMSGKRRERVESRLEWVREELPTRIIRRMRRVLFY